MKEIISTLDAPEALGPYSQAVIAGDTVYVSGQLPLDPKKGIIAEGIDAQTRQVFSNVSAILNASGCNLEHVVKVTVYLKNLADFQRMNEVYATFFTTNCPARAAVEVSALPKGALIEVDVIAHKN